MKITDAIAVLGAVLLTTGATIAPAAAQEDVRLQLSTGGVTGTYYMIAAPLAKYICDHSHLKITPNTSGGGYENIRRVDAGQAQFGMERMTKLRINRSDVAAASSVAWRNCSDARRPMDWA